MVRNANDVDVLKFFGNGKFWIVLRGNHRDDVTLLDELM